MMAEKSPCSWRRDLSGFRGLTAQEKAEFLPVLEWFESFRLHHGMEAGSEATEAFWQSEVVPKDRPRESSHLEQAQNEGCAYTTRKQALNAVVFFFRHVCGLKDPVLDVNLKYPQGAESSRKK